MLSSFSHAAATVSSSAADTFIHPIHQYLRHMERALGVITPGFCHIMIGELWLARCVQSIPLSSVAAGPLFARFPTLNSVLLKLYQVSGCTARARIHVLPTNCWSAYVEN